MPCFTKESRVERISLTEADILSVYCDNTSWSNIALGIAPADPWLDHDELGIGAIGRRTYRRFQHTKTKCAFGGI